MAACATVRVKPRLPSRVRAHERRLLEYETVGQKRKRPLPSRTWKGPVVASARRYSERPPSPMHRSPRLMGSRALLRRRTLARCMNAKLCRVLAESSLGVDKSQNAPRLPFVPTSISPQIHVAPLPSTQPSSRTRDSHRGTVDDRED